MSPLPPLPHPSGKVVRLLNVIDKLNLQIGPLQSTITGHTEKERDEIFIIRLKIYNNFQILMKIVYIHINRKIEIILENIYKYHWIFLGQKCMDGPIHTCLQRQWLRCWSGSSRGTCRSLFYDRPSSSVPTKNLFPAGPRE